jgi:predicted glycosyltransferase
VQNTPHAPAGKIGVIWIDLDNTPHVPFFKPIITELERRGWRIMLTARDAFQVCALADRMGLSYVKVGRHYGKNPFLKIAGLLWRACQLLPHALRGRPILGLSHGSRAQLLLCNLLRIPTVMLMDYEHARMPLLLRPRWEIVPEALREANLQCKSRERIRTYRGIKEDVYAPDFRPDPALPSQLGIDDNSIIVTVRPPAWEAHYHNTESDRFFVHFMNRLDGTPGVRAVLLPRNKTQDAHIRKNWPRWFEHSKVVIPTGAVDGLNLLWYSDLVVSAGGTMNREAAALGIPVYSIFRGKTGAVDLHLEEEGRLVLIRSIEEVETRIAFCRRNRLISSAGTAPRALEQIVDHLDEIVRQESNLSIPVL